MPIIRETIRDDGLRIITCRTPRSKKAYVELLAQVGYAHDPPNKRGQFHFFEHMARKGTQKRTAAQLRLDIQRHLIDMNAATERLETRYFGTTTHKKLPLAVEILVDIYFNSLYQVEEIEREKEVMQNEIARDADMDDLTTMRRLWEMLWEKSPMRIFGVGVPKDIETITREDLIRARDTWHVPSNTVALAVGDIRHEEFVSLLNQIPLNEKTVRHSPWPSDEYALNPSQKSSVIKLPGREKAIVVMGCKFPLPKDERTELLTELLSSLLGFSETSILCTEIREKRGLVYAIQTDVIEEPPLGTYFYVYAEMLPHRVSKVQKLVKELLFQPLAIPQEIFQAAIDQLLHKAELEFEGVGEHHDWARFIIEKIRLGLPVKKLERYFQRVRAIIPTLTLREVEQLRASTLTPERFATVTARPKK